MHVSTVIDLEVQMHNAHFMYKELLSLIPYDLYELQQVDVSGIPSCFI